MCMFPWLLCTAEKLSVLMFVKTGQEKQKQLSGSSHTSMIERFYTKGTQLSSQGFCMNEFDWGVSLIGE